jgi:rod shape determining protein RodA
MFRFLSRFKYFDQPLLASTLLLAAGGLALLYATTLSDGSSVVFFRQLIFLCGGLAAFFFFSIYNYHGLTKLNRLIYPIFIALLIYLPLFGSAIRGSARWIDFGFFRFQPAEFTKIIVILGISRLLYVKGGQINSWRIIIWSFAYAALPAALIAIEPDLGSAIIILSIWLGGILLSPIKKKFLAVLFLVFLVGTGATWKFVLKDFQKDRVLVFLNPELDPKGRGYNVRQATIAVGSGQFAGMGLGKGVQSQRKFLPERQTDFIFAAGSEEVGFLGSFGLLALYFFLMVRITKIMRAAKDDLGMYIAGGALFFFFFHVLINIGMNIGLLPVTGIPLPFASAGGSSLVVSFIILGIVQNVAIQSKALRF